MAIFIIVRYVTIVLCHTQTIIYILSTSHFVVTESLWTGNTLNYDIHTLLLFI